MTGRDDLDNADGDPTDGRETLRHIADAIDSGELDSTSTMRAGIGGAIAALGEPATEDESRSADRSD